MKKLLSYVLFGNEGRFWNNIPNILISNAATFPDYHMKFYVHKDCAKHVLFPLLSEPAKVFDNIEIEIIDEPIQGTKLTIWRMKGLWESDADYMFCRDLDYIVTEMERKSMEHFVKSGKRSTCIRSYCLHSIPLMAGLCGFKIKDVLKSVKGEASTFEDYLRYGVKELHLDRDEASGESWIWGCDQKLLGAFFAPMLKERNHLDCPLQTGVKAHLVGWCFKTAYFTDYKDIEIPKECNQPIMDFNKEVLGTIFIGQPYIFSGWLTNKLMNLACTEGIEMAHVLRKLFDNHPEIRFNLDEGKPA